MSETLGDCPVAVAITDQQRVYVLLKRWEHMIRDVADCLQDTRNFVVKAGGVSAAAALIGDRATAMQAAYYSLRTIFNTYKASTDEAVPTLSA